MIWKLLKSRSNFSSPTVHDKAKAVYYLLISNGNPIIKDLFEIGKTITEPPANFKAFLGNELGVIMCHISCMEAFTNFFRDNNQVKCMAE